MSVVQVFGQLHSHLFITVAFCVAPFHYCGGFVRASLMLQLALSHF
jgi:hypothetical protein